MKNNKYFLAFIFLFVFGNVVFGASNKEMPVVKAESDIIYISPNDDGVQDTGVIAFNVNIVVKSEKGYIPEYGYVIKNSNGQKVKEHTEKGQNDLSNFVAFFRKFEKFDLAKKIFWDGKDDNGKVVADGEYTVSIWVVDSSKNRTELKAGTFVVDTNVPSVEIAKPELNVFSPNADGLLDTFEIKQKGSKERLWRAFIRDANGQVVRSFRFIDDEPKDILWDGTDDRAMNVADGVYSYEIQAEDLAGNKSGIIKFENIVKDTTPTEITAVYYSQGFSPNGTGPNKTLDIKLYHEYEKNYSLWQWSLRDSETQEIVLQVSGDNNLPQQIVLDGIYKNGQLLPEGLYDFEYFVQYNHGNRPTIKDSFYVDNTPPELGLATRANPFVKTEKGDADGEVFITVDAMDNIGVEFWTLEIVDNDGNVVRTYTGKGDPSTQISWDATKEDGSNLPADNIEQYQMKLEVKDFGGNVAVFEKSVDLELLVVEKDGKLYLMVPNIVFEAYQYELDSAGEEQFNINLSSMDRVVEIYKKYPGFLLELEGHALNVFTPGSAAWDEEELILVPLTENRNKTVKAYLVKNGIPQEVIVTSAYGGRFPIVSTTDPSVWWKNRRVEFVMKKMPDPSSNVDILEGYSVPQSSGDAPEEDQASEDLPDVEEDSAGIKIDG
ncbi:MAG: gliding motility-associated C-terminal domain-containing protein [Spirochaetales bacterium]|nr:gliding motility-associated C-terminal domain-containing protein [Spirochaetales bacterium]